MAGAASQKSNTVVTFQSAAFLPYGASDGTGPRNSGTLAFVASALVAALEPDRFWRRGRRTSSPSQFGQIAFICSAQFAQYVHS
jgi:hypothetical protein